MISFRRMPWTDSTGHYFCLPILKNLDAWKIKGSQQREIERMQCILTYLIAWSACGTSSTYGIEKRLAGEDFRPPTRTRFWERIARADYRLYTHLERGEQHATDQWMSLRKLTEEAEMLRTLPLWTLLPNEPVTTFNLMSQLREIEDFCGYPIPDPPCASISDTERYLDELFRGALSGKDERNERDVYSWLHMGLFCLRLAEVSSNLAQYVVTYAGLFNVFSLHGAYEFSWIVWEEVLVHLNRWCRYLNFCPEISSGCDAINKCMEINRYGIMFSADCSPDQAFCYLDYPDLPEDKIFPNFYLSSWVGQALRARIRLVGDSPVSEIKSVLSLLGLLP